jgi:hypothetical protein
MERAEEMCLEEAMLAGALPATEARRNILSGEKGKKRVVGEDLSTQEVLLPAQARRKPSHATRLHLADAQAYPTEVPTDRHHRALYVQYTPRKALLVSVAGLESRIWRRCSNLDGKRNHLGDISRD